MKIDEMTSNVSLREQPFATPEKLHDVVAETYKIVKTKTPVIQKSMALYLANKDTESIVFKPIKVNVQQSFQQLEQILQEEYNDEDRQIVACPSSEQVHGARVFALILKSIPVNLGLQTKIIHKTRVKIQFKHANVCKQMPCVL